MHFALNVFNLVVIKTRNMSNKLPMSENFKFIIDTMMKEGFNQLPDKSPETGRPYEYKITPYSLNTTLSFKFDNLDHFVEFLKHSKADTSPEKLALISTTLIELGLDPNQFFYVNFFEQDKEVEL